MKFWQRDVLNFAFSVGYTDVDARRLAYGLTMELSLVVGVDVCSKMYPPKCP